MANKLLEFFNKDIQFIRGVGPVLSEKLAVLIGGRRVWDFLSHIPVAVKKRKVISRIKDADVGDTIVIKLKIGAHKKGGYFRGRNTPSKIMAYDSDEMPVVIQFFNTKFADYWFKQMPAGSYRFISGRLDSSGELYAINHPDYILSENELEKIPEIQPVYPLTEGISLKTMINVRDSIIPMIPDVPEWQSDKYIKNLPSFKESLNLIHNPKSEDDILPNNPARIRLAYDELLAHQISIAKNRAERLSEQGQIIKSDGKLMKSVINDLPFELTSGQKKALDEILVDMAKPIQMIRLVMGDVGSGKTIVALLAMLNAVEAGFQVALMAPTDVLAGQHFAKIRPICDKLGLLCDSLSGRDSGRTRKDKLVSLKSGRTKVLIGTHAIFQDDVNFKNLGLVVVDEQHRFGVEQRLRLSKKSGDKNLDIISMSATPIPRTLSMTMYGDMDISVISEKPANRKKIITTKLSSEKIGDLIHRLSGEIRSGSKVFWVCPLVAESETSDLMAVEERYSILKQFFGDAVAMIHGKMDKSERDKIMSEFASDNSKIKVLVATTVIEVGIDVPSASIMIIENANRFGLAALHQLRGRVGRSDKQSYCVLLYNNGVSPDAFKRLNILCETDNGFEIAEADLMMRGNGEMLGVKQSGYINYHFVDYAGHRDLFKFAQKEAMEIVSKDRNLESEYGYKIRFLMELFNRFDYVDYNKAG